MPTDAKKWFLECFLPSKVDLDTIFDNFWQTKILIFCWFFHAYTMNYPRNYLSCEESLFEIFKTDFESENFFLIRLMHAH